MYAAFTATAENRLQRQHKPEQPAFDGTQSSLPPTCFARREPIPACVLH
jgi:hypothetical protein